MRVPAFLTIPECARLAGVTLYRMRAIIAVRAPHDPDLVQGTPRRPMIQRSALAKLLGGGDVVQVELADHECRLVALERKMRG